MKTRSALLSKIAAIGLLAAALPSHAEDEIARAREYFTNLELIDQNGQTLQFFDDVLKNHVVVINFIFTNCDSACPLMTQKLSLVRDQFEGQMGNPIRFISLSIDPDRDTPAAMKAFAAQHDADHEGWVWLTGRPENLSAIIKRLGQHSGSDEVEAHSTMMLAGNVNAAHWIKIMPHELPRQIAAKLQLLLEDDNV